MQISRISRLNLKAMLAEAVHEPRQRGVAVLLFNTLCMSIGFYMLIPLIAVHYTSEHYVVDLGFSATLIGFVLALRQFTQQGLMLFGGAIADRYGHKRVIFSGLFVRAIGFFCFAFADTIPILIIAAVVAALGGALFEGTSKGAIASLARPEQRIGLFSLSGVISGVGTTIGPLVGVALLAVDFSFVAWVAGGMFTIASIVTLLLLPSGQVPPEGRPSPFISIATVLRDRYFVVFTSIFTGYHFLGNQLSISLPLYAAYVTGNSGAIGVLWAIHSAVIIFLQYPLVRFARRFLKPMSMIILGMVLMSIGITSVFLAKDMPGLIACVAVFALGGVLINPTRDTIVSELSSEKTLAAYFSFAFLALAVGGSVGNWVGGWLYDVALTTGFLPLPWLVFGSVGLLAAVAFGVFSRWPQPRRAKA